MGERLTELGNSADPSVTIADKGARAAQQQQMTILAAQAGRLRLRPAGTGLYAGGDAGVARESIPPARYPAISMPLHLKGVARRRGRDDVIPTLPLLVLTQDVGRVARQLIGVSTDRRRRMPGLRRRSARRQGPGAAESRPQPGRPGTGLYFPGGGSTMISCASCCTRGENGRSGACANSSVFRVVGLKRAHASARSARADLPLGQWRFLRDDETF